MTLLEDHINRSLGHNLPYGKKRKRYAESRYALTRDLGGDTWDADALTRRQDSMARRAVHIWRLDYARMSQ